MLSWWAAGSTAVVLAGAALVMLPWARRLARAESRWLHPAVLLPLAAAGGLFAARMATGRAELIGFSVLALGCSLLVVIDLSSCRLPDRIVAPLYPVLLVTLSVAAAASGDWSRLGRSLLAAFVLLAAYLVLVLVTPSGMGLGDVKLSGLLGAFLGWFGWSQVVVGTMAAFVLNAVVALLLLAARRVSTKSDLPFGPWMVAGAALGAAVGPSVLG